MTNKYYDSLILKTRGLSTAPSTHRPITVPIFIKIKNDDPGHRQRDTLPMILNLMKKGEKLGQITQKLLSKSTKNQENEENFKEMISGVPLIKSEKLGNPP